MEFTKHDDQSLQLYYYTSAYRRIPESLQPNFSVRMMKAIQHENELQAPQPCPLLDHKIYRNAVINVPSARR